MTRVFSKFEVGGPKFDVRVYLQRVFVLPTTASSIAYLFSSHFQAIRNHGQAPNLALLDAHQPSCFWFWHTLKWPRRRPKYIALMLTSLRPLTAQHLSLVRTLEEGWMVYWLQNSSGARICFAVLRCGRTWCERCTCSRYVLVHGGKDYVFIKISGPNLKCRETLSHKHTLLAGRS